MATRCIPRNRCNSQMSGWISGSNPSVADGKVTRTACMHSSSGCCTHYYSSVEIRNCSGFYVYNLPPTSTCNSRYCGVNSKWPCDYSLICTVLQVLYRPSFMLPFLSRLSLFPVFKSEVVFSWTTTVLRFIFGHIHFV